MTLWTVARQVPLSMEFSRQEYWTGLPFPSPGDLPDPGIKPRCPAFQADPSPSEPPEQPQANGRKKQFTARGTEQAIEGVKRCYMSLLGRECERPRGAMLPSQLENSFFFVFLIWHFSYLFDFWLHWVLVAACRLSLVTVHWLLALLASLIVESRLQAHMLQSLQLSALVPPWHVESSETRDAAHVPCIGRQILIQL